MKTLLGAMLLAVVSGAHAYQPGDPPKTFKQAATAATSLKGCKKAHVGKIDSVRLYVLSGGEGRTVEEADLPRLRLNPSRDELLLMVTTDKDDGTESNLVGPLKTVPSRAEMDGLLGKHACAKSLSLFLCARHTMTNRSMYAKQEESAGRVAGHPR